MLLAALIDAGAPVDDVRAGLEQLGIADLGVEVERTDRHGLTAVRVRVTTTNTGVDRRLGRPFAPSSTAPACRRARTRAPTRCSGSSRTRKGACMTWRPTACTSTRSERSTRSPTSAAWRSRSKRSPWTASPARRCLSGAVWSRRRTVCFRCRRRRPSSSCTECRYRCRGRGGARHADRRGAGRGARRAPLRACSTDAARAGRIRRRRARAPGPAERGSRAPRDLTDGGPRPRAARPCSSNARSTTFPASSSQTLRRPVSTPARSTRG